MLRRPFSLLFFARKKILPRGQPCMRLPGFWHHYSQHLPVKISSSLLQRPLIMHSLWFKRENKTTSTPYKWIGYNLSSSLMINGLFALRMLYQITASRHFMFNVSIIHAKAKCWGEECGDLIDSKENRAYRRFPPYFVQVFLFSSTGMVFCRHNLWVELTSGETCQVVPPP